jgi:hypothetical protein
LYQRWISVTQKVWIAFFDKRQIRLIHTTE